MLVRSWWWWWSCPAAFNWTLICCLLNSFLFFLKLLHRTHFHFRRLLALTSGERECDDKWDGENGADPYDLVAADATEGVALECFTFAQSVPASTAALLVVWTCWYQCETIVTRHPLIIVCRGVLNASYNRIKNKRRKFWLIGSIFSIAKFW